MFPFRSNAYVVLRQPFSVLKPKLAKTIAPQRLAVCATFSLTAALYFSMEALNCSAFSVAAGISQYSGMTMMSIESSHLSTISIILS